MPHDAKSIIKRFETLAGERTTFESTWQEIADNVIGRRDFQVLRTPGQNRMQTIYDTTGMLAAQLLASGLHTLLTNSATKWFRLKPEDDRLLDFDGVKEWFELAESQMYAAVNRPEARFTPQMHELYMDLVTFGTAGMFISDEPGRGVLFSSRPLAELFIATNSAGRVDSVYRKFKMTARQAQQEWGQGIVKKADNLVAQDSPNETLEFLHWVYPRDDPAFGQNDASGMPWLSTYLSMEDAKIIAEGGFWEMPYLTPRWSIDAGENYGRGPGFTALSDQKMLNEMSKTLLKGAQKAVDPPVLMDDDGVITQLRLSPGGINVVRSGLPGDPIRPFQNQARVDIGVDMLEHRRVAVRAAFHFELLQLLQHRPGSTPMTATQVVELSNQMQRLLSPILGRQQVELLEPMIERVFGIIERQNRLPDPPPELADTNIRVEYVSPVAMAQKATDAKAIIETFTVAANLSQVDPSVMDNLDTDQAIRLISEANGAPLSILVDAERMEAQRQAERDLAAEQAAMEEAKGASEVASNVAPLVQQQAQGVQ